MFDRAFIIRTPRRLLVGAHGDARLRALLAGFVLAAATLGMGGCIDEVGLRAARNDAAALAAQLEDERDAVQRYAETIPVGDPARPAAEVAVQTAEARLAALDAAVAHADAALAELDNPEGVGSLIAPLLPGPWQAPAALAAALGVTLLRAGQLKRAARSIATSVEKAKQADPALAERFADNADTLRTIQTPTARRIVDEVIRPAPMLRLPV